jgi:hypothetical protein
MSGRLASYVHVRDADGVVHVFGPDDEVPEWAAALITNPVAWAEPPSGNQLPDPDAPPMRRAATRRRASDGAVHGG